ncbi:MAG TPA: DUF4157 domain-containing protein [Puia sp.]|nr:DUF4157 domain-containing protein [Puia sp.]
MTGKDPLVLTPITSSRSTADRESLSDHRSLADQSPKGALSLPAVPVLQKQPAPSGNTSLPANLKTGVEQLSGFDMSDVQVHYNSDKPAQLNALAYAQGTDIHLGQGQEKHLPHEAWHVVQQKQGRVQPTVQRQTGIAINDDPALEKEADRMGSTALQHSEPDPIHP